MNIADVIEEITLVLKEIYQCEPEKFPVGNLELIPEKVPLYFEWRGNYNPQYKMCPVVIHQNPKYEGVMESTPVFAVGCWKGFSEETLEKEWVSVHRKKETILLNKSLVGLTLKEQVDACISFNVKGQEEGWLNKDESPCLINMCPFDSEVKVSKSEHCDHSLNINLHYRNIEESDITYIIELLQTPKFWWREYERINLWETCNKLIELPKDGVLFTSVADFNKAEMPPIELIGKILNINERPDLESHTEKKMYNWITAPVGFKNLADFCWKGLRENQISEGHYYSTVRYGECRSGASNRFTFNLALNEQVYEVEFYGSDRGGSPERPARYGRDLTIKKSEEESNFALNTGILADNLIFRNLARKLNASLYFGE